MTKTYNIFEQTIREDLKELVDSFQKVSNETYNIVLKEDTTNKSKIKIFKFLNEYNTKYGSNYSIKLTEKAQPKVNKTKKAQ